MVLRTVHKPKNRSFAGRTVHRQKLINKPSSGFRTVVALQRGNSKARHSKEWLSELALSLKNHPYCKKPCILMNGCPNPLLHDKVKDNMLLNRGPGIFCCDAGSDVSTDANVAIVPCWHGNVATSPAIEKIIYPCSGWKDCLWHWVAYWSGRRAHPNP
jgi:hypothetical protein